MKVVEQPGICPNMSAKPPNVSLSSFTLLGMKGFSRKKSILMPWDMGAGMKTPKSWSTQMLMLLFIHSEITSWHKLQTPVRIVDINCDHYQLTFTASWRIWLIVFGPLSMKALRGTQLFSRSSTVSCSRKRILAGNSLLFIKDRIRAKYWSIKDWREGKEDE